MTSWGCEGITYSGLEVWKGEKLADGCQWEVGKCVGVKKSKLTMTPIGRKLKSYITG